MKLVLNELDQDADEFKQIAVWNPDEDAEIPDAFTRIYPEGTWENRPPEYFLERIDGPYTMLTRVDDDEEVELDPWPPEESDDMQTESDAEEETTDE